ncbi:hypothetical protein GCM10027188_04760 [Lysobacter humi (ex Lee et al. 2017)]
MPARAAARARDSTAVRGRATGFIGGLRDGAGVDAGRGIVAEADARAARLRIGRMRRA